MEEKSRPGKEERDVIVRVWDEKAEHAEHGVVTNEAEAHARRQRTSITCWRRSVQ